MIFSSPRQHWARVAVGLVVLVAAHLLLQGYVTDDTYIHLRYAENLATRGEFSFNPGESTYGATSPLWIIGLVLLFQVGISGPTAAWILGLLSGALTVLVLASLLRRFPFPESWRWWLFLLAIVDAWFLRWTASGMETPLATAVLLILLWPLVMPGLDEAVVSNRRRLWPRYLAWGVAAGLAGLVRPEFMLIAPAALPWLLQFEYRRAGAIGGAQGRHRARPWSLMLAAAIGWLASIGPWLFYAQATFGRWMPGTASAKSNTATFDLVEIIRYLGRSLQQMGLTQGVVWLFFAAVVIFVLVERLRQEHTDDHDEDLSRRGRWQYWQAVTLVLIALTWIVLLLGGYAVKRVWTISSYLSPLGPVTLLMLGVLAFWLLNLATPYRGRPTLGSRIAPLICGLALLGNIALLAGPVRRHAKDFSRGVVSCYLDKGVWIGEHSTPNDVIAALDIGAVAYGSNRRVLDLMGLVSPGIMALGREVGFETMVQSGMWLRAGTDGEPPPSWLVDRHEGPPRWDGRTVRGVTFELVDTCLIHGVGLRESQDWTVSTYRLRR